MTPGLIPDAVGDEAHSAFDLALAESLTRAALAHAERLRGAIAQLSAVVRQGHSCLPLAQLGAADAIARPTQIAVSIDPATLREQLFASGIVGIPGAELPLICDGERLYLRRYFEYERFVADELLRRSAEVEIALDVPKLRARLEAFFPAGRAPAPDWQRVAAVLALRRKLCLIFGGPGTGKTWTVLRLLALLAENSATPLRIALAAPTGKAAMRIGEHLQRDLATLPLADSVRVGLPRGATTVHRLLGMRPHSSVPRYHAKQPLPLDVLVLDEASMIDLPTMARVLAALPPQARLILLGDPDQLASIEIGNVLAELRGFNPHNRYTPAMARVIEAALGTPVPTATGASRFGDGMVTLSHSHRFTADGAIAQLVAAVRAGEADRACEILRAGGAIRWHETEPSMLVAQTLALASERYAPLRAVGSAEQGLQRLARFRVLGALRHGPCGIRALNAAIARAQLQLPSWQPLPDCFSAAPLLLSENVHALRLYNGDSGLLLADAQGRLRAWFSDSEHGLRSFAPTQLPAFELGYAMTVHKAQGSEYDEVLVLLPPQPHPLLTREWLYTALSRARQSLIVLGNEAVLRAAIARPAQRSSGLAAQIVALQATTDNDGPASA